MQNAKTEMNTLFVLISMFITVSDLQNAKLHKNAKNASQKFVNLKPRTAVSVLLDPSINFISFWFVKNV